jgi:amphi-Trp domain-containing protein
VSENARGMVLVDVPRLPDALRFEGILLASEEVRVAGKRDRDIEKTYSVAEFVAKLRRLADALEAGERFEIQVAGERIYVPARAVFNIEHEREGDEEEIEFQLKWTNG